MINVDILIPVHNGEKYIKDTIKSILNQTYNNIRIIIVDDGSTDNTINIIKAFELKNIVIYRNKTNKGLPYTRNKLLELSCATYIAFLDADDICEPKRIEEQVDFLEKNYNIDMVGSNAVYFNGIREKKSDKPIETDEIICELIFNNCIINSSVMIRKAFIDKHELRYREGFFVCQDYSMWIDICKYGKIANISEALIRYRTGHNNISKKSSITMKEERKRILYDIHKRALEQNGFILTNQELNIINIFFSEERNVIIEKYKIKEIEKIFNKLIKLNEKNKKIDEKIFNKVAKNNVIYYLSKLKISLIYKLVVFNKINFKDKSIKDIKYLVVQSTKNSIIYLIKKCIN